MFKKQIFGLDISDHSIEALMLKKSLFGPPKIISYSRVILQGEIVKNGIIKKPDKLGENILKSLQIAGPKKIKTPYCILSLPESQVFSTIFKLPAGLKRREIKNTIPYKAEEVIPFKSPEIYFDFKAITRKDETQEVFYAAVPTKIVDAYVDVLRSIGLKPVAFDLESISLARALLDLKKKPDEARLMMDIGARTTNLNIFDRNGIRQSLVVKIAGDRFTKSIADNLKIASKEAAELKIKNGFDPQKQDGKVLLILQKEFKRIIEETKKVIDYYRSQTQRQVKEIVLVGGSALLPEADQYLADNLGAEVNLGNPFLKISDPKKLVNLKNKAILFTNVAGLALRGMEKDPLSSDINLLPVRIRKFAIVPAKMEKKAWFFIYLRLAIFIVLILGLVGLFSLREKNYDLYQKVFPAPQYETNIDPNIDIGILDELRQHFLSPKVEPTTTPEIVIVEPELRIKVKATNVGYVNVRQGPGTNYPKVGEVKASEEYKLLGEEEQWYQIQLTADKTGWIFSIYGEKFEVKSQPNPPEPEGTQ